MQPKFRPSQQRILEYKSGWMGISAVPGSGKTFTLSALAARIITSGVLDADQEVLVVTLTNTAANNFQQQVSSFLQGETLIPGLGFRVRTLHGLAHDILKDRPAQVGLTGDFSIIDEHSAHREIEKAVYAWISMNPNEVHDQLDESLYDSYKQKDILRKNMPDLFVDVASAFIRKSKDYQLDPEVLRQRMSDLDYHHPVLEMCIQVYAEYQRSLSFRGGVDFDDLIRWAAELVTRDIELRERLHNRWPYILEDEAQDSSRLQELILRTLAGEGGNWVRVGDPNQAIYETFTTASPEYLRSFIHSPGVISSDLPASGRSTELIINLANHFLDWCREDHPNPLVHAALSLPHIIPVEKDDPAANPPDDTTVIKVIGKVFTPEEERDNIAKYSKTWVENNPERTIAVLSQMNKPMEDLAEVLDRYKVPHFELLNSSKDARETARLISNVVKYLVDPRNNKLCADAFLSQIQARTEVKDVSAAVKQAEHLILKIRNLEDYLYPLENDLFTDWAEAEVDGSTLLLLKEFQTQLRGWLAISMLPVDQLILSIALDLFHNPADLALAHKLASVVAVEAGLHPDWRLPDFSTELITFVTRERKMKSFDFVEEPFDPQNYKGKVLLTTIHKAKGLEWDKVYLTSLNNYDFPSGSAGDPYISEKWFIKGKLNLQAEALAMLDFLAENGEMSPPRMGEATLDDRHKLAAERLRLIFVGITRARQELSISCNNGKSNSSQKSIALLGLEDIYERYFRYSGNDQ